MVHVDDIDCIVFNAIGYVIIYLRTSLQDAASTRDEIFKKNRNVEDNVFKNFLNNYKQ